MKTRLRFRRTTLISVGLAAFLLGLILARLTVVWLSVGWLIFSLPFLLLHRYKNLLAMLGIVVIGGLLGLWRGGNTLSQLGVYNNFYGQNVILNGQVQTDPVYDERGQLDFRVNEVHIENKSLPGQVRVRGHVNDVKRGDFITAKGKLQTGFGNYQAFISFAEIEVRQNSNSWVEKARRGFFASTYSVLPEPHASLGLGFLVGLRSALPEDFDEQLQIVGLTHIVVASGYNLTILVRLSRRLLAKRSKYQAFAGSIALILAFMAVTGASASITRAAVVTILSLVAWYYGRRINPILLVLLGAGLTAAINPLYIWFDLGWWLSFLAFVGVLVIAPILMHAIFKAKQPHLLIQVGIETLAAQALALPLIMYVFGDISIVSIIANVSVAPLLPYAMLATFVAGSAGLISSTIGAWLAVPANIMLSYIVGITQVLASPSWASQEVGLGKVGLVLIYVSVFIVSFVIYKRTKFKFIEAPSIVE